MKAIAHPSAAKPGVICAIDIADKLLRLQSCRVEDRMMKGVLIINQGGINIALGVQGDKAGVIIWQALQTVDPVGQINAV